jgi:hypothetical protein
MADCWQKHDVREQGLSFSVVRSSRMRGRFYAFEGGPGGSPPRVLQLAGVIMARPRKLEVGRETGVE